MFKKQQKFNESQTEINESLKEQIANNKTGVTYLEEVIKVLINTHPNKSMLLKQLEDVNKKNN